MRVTEQTVKDCPVRVQCVRVHPVAVVAPVNRSNNVSPGEFYDAVEARVGTKGAPDGWLKVRNRINRAVWYSAENFIIADDGRKANGLLKPCRASRIWIGKDGEQLPPTGNAGRSPEPRNVDDWVPAHGGPKPL